MATPEGSIVTPLPQNPPQTKKESLGELGRTALIAILLAVLIRSFLYEPFNIPSGSMMPTLLVGDFLFVSKRDYGYSRYSFPFGIVPIDGRMWVSDMPKRGDVIVFKLPSDNRTDYIKRLIGMPGDTIQTVNGRLYINNKLVPREPVGQEQVEDGRGGKSLVTRYIETLPGGVLHYIYEKSDVEELDNAGPFVVPNGHYFMMGDNRDNSWDSRVQNLVGFVPFENLVGRADILFFSIDGSFLAFWEWPWTIRGSRIFQTIGPPAALAKSTP